MGTLADWFRDRRPLPVVRDEQRQIDEMRLKLRVLQDLVEVHAFEINRLKRMMVDHGWLEK
jgi:hypothetical protein